MSQQLKAKAPHKHYRCLPETSGTPRCTWMGSTRSM